MISVLDYRMGNIRSVQKAFERINIKVQVTNEPDMILKSDKLVIPGVGRFNKGMELLNKLKLVEVLNQFVLNDKKMVLGICLGMQLMTNYSEEGDTEGLCWIDALTHKFKSTTSRNKIPHMGWNTVKINKSNGLIDISEMDSFYFVHSYYVNCNNESDVLFETDYNVRFHSGFRKDHIIGVQFHPEKSHDSGLKILKYFSQL